LALDAEHHRVSRDDELVLTFIRHFWISLHGPTTENELGEEIETKIKNEPQVLDFVAALDSAAEDYAALLTALQHPRWHGYPSGTRKAIDIIINDLSAVQIRPLMLAIAKKFTPKETLKAFQLLISWTVRFLIVGGGSQGKLHRYYGDRGEISHRRQDCLGKGFGAEHGWYCSEQSTI
jgi:hypothetical protein